MVSDKMNINGSISPFDMLLVGGDFLFSPRFFFYFWFRFDKFCLHSALCLFSVHFLFLFLLVEKVTRQGEKASRQRYAFVGSSLHHR